jgi:hypothetical protein
MACSLLPSQFLGTSRARCEKDGPMAAVGESGERIL